MKNFKLQTGQTLIETIVALFILITGVSAAVGLAIFAFSTSTTIVKQIVAIGLAREGIEAARNMRDTNWLQGTLSDDCTGYPSGTADCYKSWHNEVYCINSTGNQNACSGNSNPNYFLEFDATETGDAGSGDSFWKLNKSTGNSNRYGLLFSQTGGSKGFYYTGNGGVACSSAVAGISDYCRRILVAQVITPPYDTGDGTDLGPMLLIKSQVWWTDKKCKRQPTWPGTGQCSVELDTYLTNWKNY